MAESKSHRVSTAVTNPNHGSIDIISSLPDYIIQHILSFRPTKHAITTSILSKRWRHVWTKLPSLSFDSRQTDPNSISKTLSSYSSLNLKSFKLIITPQVPVTQINSWIEFGMSRNPEELNLELIDNKNYKFQDSFFINSFVKDLTLELSFPETIAKPNVAWSSLTTLKLIRCNLTDESFAAILSGSPMLETLVLIWCKELRNLDLSNSLKVKRLDLRVSTWPGMIVAPHIRYLKIRNYDYRTSLVDASSLIEAKLYVGYICKPRPFNEAGLHLEDHVLKMLVKLQNVEELTVNTVVLQFLSLLEIRGVPLPQLKVKTLTIETVLIHSVVPGITKLLQSSPGLKKITINPKITANLMDEEELDNYLIAQGLSPDRCRGGLFPKVEKAIQAHQTFATATNRMGIHIARLMLIVARNAMKLEATVLRLEGYLSEAEYQKLVSKFPTVSRDENDRKCGQTKVIRRSLKVIR